MPLQYFGRKLIPAPLVNVVKNYVTNGGGSKLGTRYDITVEGTILPYRGSPSGNYSSPSTAFWELSNYPPDDTPTATPGESFNLILRKQEAIRWLFAQEGKSFEYQAEGGLPVVKCNPRIVSVDFPKNENNWTTTSDYVIRLDTDSLSIDGEPIEDSFAQDLLSSASEAWQFDENVGRNGLGYSVSHTVSAQGIVGYEGNGNKVGGNDGWQNAKVFCDARATGTVDSTMMTATIGTNTWIGGDYTRGVTSDENGGSYSITETWNIQPTDTFTEKSFNVNFGADGTITAVYNGTIRGISDGQRTGSPQAITAAKNAVPTDAQAKTEITSAIGSLFTGNTIPDSPSSKTIAVSDIDGTVTFSFEYNLSDEDDFSRQFEATINFDLNSSSYVVSLSTTIQGHGDTAAERLTNARSGILSDSAARTKAIGILGSQIPGGVTISTTVRNKNTVIDETRGSIRSSVSWDDTTAENNLDITVRTQNPASVFASIAIPGRSAGPIIQNMSTVTAEIVTVIIVGVNQTTQPDGLTLALAQLSNPGSYMTIGNEESYNAVKKRYDGTFRFLNT